MKLLYSPGACSLSPHIVAREAGLPVTLEKADFETGRTEGGQEIAALNSKGYVPALILDDGSVLTEGAAIVQYLADQAPGKGLIPAGGIERYRCQEWLNWVATELHKGFSPLFQPVGEETKRWARERQAERLTWLDGQLADGQRAGRTWLLGDRFSVADAYLFTVLNWSEHVGMDLGRWPAVKAFRERVGARPAVQEALRAEGLM